MIKLGSKKHGLKSNFAFNFISQILTLIIPLITTPYLARVLQETGNGQYSYAFSIITYFTLFANLGFDVYGQRQIAAAQGDIEAKSKVFWEIFTFKTILTVISVAVLYSISFTVGFGDNYTNLILILSIQVIAVPFDIQFLYRGEEDFAIIAIRSIILKVVGLICIFLFVKQQSDTWIYALCIAGSTVLSNLIMWTTLKNRIKLVSFKSIKLWRHFKPMMLIFFPALAVTVYSVFDKTMIGLLAENPDYQNGCYEQAYKLNGVALLLVTVISSVMVSRNAHDYSVGDMDSVKRHIYLAGNYTFMIGLPLIAGFFVLSGNLCSWFLGDGYAEVPLLLQIMSVRFIFSGLGEIFGSQLFIAIGKEKYPTIATGISAVVNITLNLFLIKYWGAVGATITTAISEFLVTAILACFVMKGKYVSVGKMILSSWKYLVSALIMGTAIYFIQKFMPYGIWSFLVITAIGVIIYALSLFALRDKFFLTFMTKGKSFVLRKLKKSLKTEEPLTDEENVEITESLDENIENNDENTETDENIQENRPETELKKENDNNIDKKTDKTAEDENV